MKKILALALVAGFSLPALAGDYYVGADLARTRVSDADVSGNGGSLFGGYRYNDHLGVELGYRRLLSKTVTEMNVPVKVKADAVQLSALGYVPLSTDLALFGRLGVNRIEIEGSAGGFRAKDSDTKLLAGIGMAYDLSKAVALRLEFQKPASDARVFAAGLQIRL